MARTLAEIAEKIRERIRPVCPNMPDDELNALVQRMAEFEYKHDQSVISTSLQRTYDEPMSQ